MFSLGQLMMMGIQGPELSQDEIKFIKESKMGGVILFSRNYQSPEQLFDLCERIQAIGREIDKTQPLWIGIDMEGGRVHRLKVPYTQWPAVKNLGLKNSPSLAFSFAQGMGLELAATGINLNFAPCIDILTNPQNKVIGDRSLSSEADTVAHLASALVRGYLKAQIQPCAKHFPGHGNTLLDSHEDLPNEKTSLDVLRNREFLAFKKSIQARLNMVMTSHIVFESVDPENPVTFSKKFIHDFLRGELRFQGVVISDDLDMGALVKHYNQEEIPIRALQGGCDLLLYCNNPESPKKAYEVLKKSIQDKTLDINNLILSYQRVRAVKSLLPQDQLNKKYLIDLLDKEENQKIVHQVLAPPS